MCKHFTVVVLNIFEQALIRAGVIGTKENIISGTENTGSPNMTFYSLLYVDSNYWAFVTFSLLSHGDQRGPAPRRDLSTQFTESSGGEVGGTRRRPADVRQRSPVSEAAGGPPWPLCAAHVGHPHCRSLHCQAAHAATRAG